MLGVKHIVLGGVAVGAPVKALVVYIFIAL